MIKMILREFNKSSSGFTLINLIVSLAISSVLMTGLAVSIQQLSILPRKTQANSAVTQQTQNSCYWISRDAQRLQNFSEGDDPNTPELEVFTFSWVSAKRTDSNRNDYIDTHKVRYLLESGKLCRNEHLHTDKFDQYGDFVSSTNSQKTTAIAEYISNISGSLGDNALTVSITFSYDNAQLQRTYEIFPRVNLLE